MKNTKNISPNHEGTDSAVPNSVYEEVDRATQLPHVSQLPFDVEIDTDDIDNFYSRDHVKTKTPQFGGGKGFEFDFVQKLKRLHLERDKFMDAVSGIISPEDLDHIVSTFEAVGLYLYKIASITTWNDFIVETIIFFKMITPPKTSLLGLSLRFFVEHLVSIWTDTEISVQGGLDDLMNFKGFSDSFTFKGLATAMSNFDSIFESKLAKKFIKFIKFLSCFSFMRVLGLNLESDEIKSKYLLDKLYAKNWHFGVDFAQCVWDLSKFVISKCALFFETGDYSVFFQDADDVTRWGILADELYAKSLYLGDPQGHNLDVHKYRLEVMETLDNGKQLMLNIPPNHPNRTYISTKVLQLVRIEAEMNSQDAIMRPRQSPFAVLVAGNSSIGKSSVIEILFHYYAKVSTLCGQPLESDKKYFYTLNPKAKYWDGFTSQWCVNLDDIACNFANGKQEDDETLDELLQVVNNVAYMPDQAALEKKGKTPLQAKLCLATTNQIDLNVRYYYQHPYAVIRRFPIILEVRVKEEFATNFNGVTRLDPAKASFARSEGGLQDLWTFHTYKAEPYLGKNERTLFKLVPDTVFTNIQDFLAYYGTEIRNHIETQQKVLNVMSSVKDIKVCESCLRTNCSCGITSFEPQTGRSRQNRRPTYTGLSYSNCHSVRAWVLLTLYYILTYSLSGCSHLLHYISVGSFKVALSIMQFSKWLEDTSKWLRYLPVVALLRLVTFPLAAITSVSQMFDRCILRFSERLTYTVTFVKLHKCNILKAIGVLLPMVLALFFVYKHYSKKDEKKSKNTIVPHGAVYGKPPAPMSYERPQVWYNGDIPTVNMEVSQQSQSLKGRSLSEIISIWENNLYTVIFHRDEEYSENRAFAIVGQVFCMNKHAAVQKFDYLFLINTVGGVTRKRRIERSALDFKYIEGTDIALFEVLDLPPHRSLLPYFVDQDVNHALPATYVMRLPNGSIDTIPLSHILSDRTIDKKVMSQLGMHPGNALRGEVRNIDNVRATQHGDCGSLAVHISTNGPLILGMHIAALQKPADGKIVYAQVFKQSLLLHFLKKHFSNRVLIQGGFPFFGYSEFGTPILGPLHHKATVRYIEDGNATVYGSFVRSQPTPKSRVGFTHISRFIQELTKDDPLPIIDCTVPPYMRGWEPKRASLAIMVNTNDKVDCQLLRTCVDSFTTDILSRMDVKYMNHLHVLDDMTTINGYPGISYLDKVKRQTSAGFPWSTPKTRLAVKLPPTELYQDPIDFIDDVKRRVSTIMSMYERGSVSCPVFTAHFKDEPVSREKAEKKKTRVFCGAPLDFALIVRKFLLPFVRVLQSNRFIFEAAPGTVVTSFEWQQLYDYLIAFGEGNIVAGDYSKFDKRMPPHFILAAFDVIRNVCEASGNYSESELQIIDCIALDTAFPSVNFFGDLIQFHGTNPSGHPLTVIVNSLVNSLYIRYAFSKCCPNVPIEKFQSLVHLMTYGDDNIMGISDSVVNRFNHVTIARALGDIGVVYTTADKTTIVNPTINIKDASFLKRNWVWHDELKVFGCVIEHDSISKRLTRCLHSKTYHKEFHSVEVLTSALDDYFWYGKETFEHRRAQFLAIIEHFELQAYCPSADLLPTWETLVNRFHKQNFQLHLLKEYEKYVGCSVPVENLN